MTVKELIELLSKEDPNAMVVVDGYEFGLNELKSVKSDEVYLNVYDEPYSGKHSFVSDCSIDSDDPKAKVVYLPRN